MPSRPADRPFGALPVEAENLLQVVAFKQLCRSSGVERLESGPRAP
jgi:transcription-repair coupling factor (superfamily II helicase)